MKTNASNSSRTADAATFRRLRLAHQQEKRAARKARRRRVAAAVGRAYGSLRGKQRYVHLFVPPLILVAALVAWHYLPPWLAQNPGVIMLMGILITADFVYFVTHDR
jgi:Flp pilus assembly protein TadB